MSFAGNSHSPAPNHEKYFSDSQVTPFPLDAYPAIKLSETRKQNLFIKLPARARPELFERVSNRRYTPLSWKVVKINDGASAEAKTCWYVVISGGTKCYSNIYKMSKINPPHLKVTHGEVDLLEYSRWAKKTYGMRIARDLLYYRMNQIDSSKGKIEARVLQTTKNPNLSFPDALVNLPAAHKKRIGFFVVYGLDVTDGDSPNRALIRSAASKAKDFGFYTKIFDTLPFGNSDKNAEMIGAQFVEESRFVDEIVILSVSKGTADVIRTLVVRQKEVMNQFPKEKLKLVVSLVGAVRESYIANWIVQSDSATPFVLKTFLKSKKGDVLEGIKSLASGPWENKNPKSLGDLYPNLNWLTFSMLPEGPDGHLKISAKADFIRESITANEENISPGDGLMESAATLLPPGTMVPQYVVRGFGPHTLALGRFADSTPISKLQNAQAPVIPEAGAEILDSFLRAIPKSLIEGR